MIDDIFFFSLLHKRAAESKFAHSVEKTKSEKMKLSEQGWEKRTSEKIKQTEQEWKISVRWLSYITAVAFSS